VWKQYLYTAVASLNFSGCFTWRQHIIVVGTRANRIATLEMASYLIDTVERLANKEAAEVPVDERRRFRHSYAEGCATRIYERLEQMRVEAHAGRMKAEDPNSLLPALADLYQTNRARVDDFIADHFGKVYHRTHYTSGGHHGGYIVGYNAGGKVGLHRQIGRKPAVDRLKDTTTINQGTNHTTGLYGCSREQPEARRVGEVVLAGILAQGQAQTDIALVRASA
jgi:hypothetical protein